MSLGALAFGLIIDGAVIIVESVMHQFTHNSKFRKALSGFKTGNDTIVIDSAGKMMNRCGFRADYYSYCISANFYITGN